MKKSLLGLLVLVGCNSGGGGSSDAVVPTGQFNSYVVATVSLLPTCNSSRTGQLYYVTADQEFQTCDGTSWSVITIGNSIASGFGCIKSSLSKLFQYKVISYQNGDVWTVCSISDNSTTTTMTQFYKSTQTGALNAACTLTYDLDSATAGFWNFTATTNVTAVYNDTGSASDGTTVTYLNGDCTAF